MVRVDHLEVFTLTYIKHAVKKGFSLRNAGDLQQL